MNQRHYKKLLTSFVNHELSKNDQHEIARHLLQCVGCRREHDRIKLGASLASQLRRSDAPTSVWNEIENALDAKSAPQMTLIPQASLFNLRSLTGYAVGLLVVAGLASIFYLTLLRSDKREARKDAGTPDQTQNSAATSPDLAAMPVNAEQSNSNTPPTNSNTVVAQGVQSPELATIQAWQIETLAGMPKVGPASSTDRLAVGDLLETDAASRVRITVANIGNVEIEPNSRVKLVGTSSTEHRLSLELGVLQAQISAPPRLFIVDTPSAVAVDLGCEYRLEVDKAGNSRLHVTRGFVALERDSRESIVPAGAICLTKHGKGLGTPFAADTSDAFRAALQRFDFSNGGSRAVKTMLDSRSFYDMITLWHLLSRVQKSDREKVFDALSEYVKPPAEVTRDGILKLDKNMLAAWRTEVERVWFE